MTSGPGRVVLTTVAAVVVVAVAGVAGLGALRVGDSTDRALRERGTRATPPSPSGTPTVLGTEASRSPAPTPDATASSRPATQPTVQPTVQPTARPTVRPVVEPLLAPGDHGVRVRELQGRLTQLAWFVPPMTGRYDAQTRTAVRGFQAKRGLRATGVVEPRTWRRLLAMSRMPTGDEMFNRAGPPLLREGDQGGSVRVLQARLRQIAWLSGDVTDHYGPVTTAAVRGFQAKRHVPATGRVDRRTLDLLEAMTSDPTADELANRAPDPADGAPLDPRCRTGRVLCIDKTSASLRWVVDGSVRTSLDVRFGSEYTPTREGVFSVYWKHRDHDSRLYGSAMPYSMFFSRGQAVHYSSDFAARGYAGASHGCVNVRDRSGIASLFAQVHTGDRVVVYRS